MSDDFWCIFRWRSILFFKHTGFNAFPANEQKTTKIRLPFRIKMKKGKRTTNKRMTYTHTKKNQHHKKKIHTKFSGIVQRCTKHTKPYKAHNCQIHLICSLSKLSNIAHWFNKFLPLFSSYNDHTVVVFFKYEACHNQPTHNTLDAPWTHYNPVLTNLFIILTAWKKTYFFFKDFAVLFSFCHVRGERKNLQIKWRNICKEQIFKRKKQIMSAKMIGIKKIYGSTLCSFYNRYLLLVALCHWQFRHIHLHNTVCMYVFFFAF